MNFLDLVRRLQSECGVSGSPLAGVSTASGELVKLINWVSAAWLDIQSMETEWQFMRQSFSFNTTIQKFSYTPAQAGITSFANWKRDSMRVYLTSAGAGGETYLPWIPYDSWRDSYQFGARRTTYSRPIEHSIDPVKNLVLGATPDAIYTINGEYFSQPVLLGLDTDIPVIDTQFHMMIVYWAMEHYGYNEVAEEKLTEARLFGGPLLSRLRFRYLPEITIGGALA
jgi:hypothetical protein